MGLELWAEIFCLNVYQGHKGVRCEINVNDCLIPGFEEMVLTMSILTSSSSVMVLNDPRIKALRSPLLPFPIPLPVQADFGSNPSSSIAASNPAGGLSPFLLVNTTSFLGLGAPISPCGLYGKCIDKVNSYQCQCAPGITGTNCSTNTNECVNTGICQSGGVCVDLINDFQCLCATGYSGKRCETG